MGLFGRFLGKESKLVPVVDTNVRDAELDTLLASEGKAFNNMTVVPLLVETAKQLDLLGNIKRIAADYEAAGGSLNNASRICQIWVDQRVSAYLDTIDLPGPDAYIKPKIREMIVNLVAQKFHALVSSNP